MKRFLPVLAVMSVLLVTLAFTGCLSSGSSSTNTNTTTTITLYDNAPSDSAAQAALLLVRAANANYTSATSFTYTGTPDASSVKPILSYYATCEAIARGIKEVHGACTLSFNTKADGSGQLLNFSTTQDAVASLLLMSLYNYTSVYAIYTF